MGAERSALRSAIILSTAFSTAASSGSPWGVSAAKDSYRGSSMPSGGFGGGFR